tara:strand:+ start:18286 stop:20085 length:1800 start_codon:yes stop_codon:yes gene_type:complete
MAVKKEIEINVNSKGATKGIDDVSDSIEGASSATSGLSGSLDKMTGGAISAFKGIVSGAKKGVMAMKSLKFAIAATGIGAIVIAVVALGKAFTSSEEGQNKFAKIMGVIGSITGNFVDLLADLGEKIIWVFENPKQALKDFGNLLKDNIQNRLEGMLEFIPAVGKALSLVFKGEFKAAGKVAADAVGKVTLGVESVTDSIVNATKATGGFIEELQREAGIAANIADKRATADKKERALLVERAEANRDRADLLEKAANKELYTAEERIAFLQKAGEIEDEITSKEIEAAQLRYDAKVAENALSKSTKEDLDDEAALKAKLIDLETAKLTKAKLVTSQIVGAKKQQAAEEKAIQADLDKVEDEKDAARLEAIKAEADARKKITETTLAAQDLELLKTTDKYAALIASAEKYGIDTSALVTAQAEDVNNIKAKYDKVDSDRKKKKADDDKAVNAATLNAIGGALGSLSELAGKDAAAGKALSAAQAVINTYTGATKALSQGGIAGPIAAAGVIASGIVSIRKIYATKLPATAGGSGGSGSAPRITAPSITPRLTLDTQVSDLGNQITGSLGKAPLRAYVVNQDVQTAAQMDRKIRQTATIG